MSDDSAMRWGSSSVEECDDMRTCYSLGYLPGASGVARISKLRGHIGDVARRADAGVGFLGRGSAAGPLPIS